MILRATFPAALRHTKADPFKRNKRLIEGDILANECLGELDDHNSLSGSLLVARGDGIELDIGRVVVTTGTEGLEVKIVLRAGGYVVTTRATLFARLMKAVQAGTGNGREGRCGAEHHIDRQKPHRQKSSSTLHYSINSHVFNFSTQWTASRRAVEASTS